MYYISPFLVTLKTLAALIPVMREISSAYGVGFRTFVLPARWGEPTETTTKIITVLHGVGVKFTGTLNTRSKNIDTRYVCS